MKRRSAPATEIKSRGIFERAIGAGQVERSSGTSRRTSCPLDSQIRNRVTKSISSGERPIAQSSGQKLAATYIGWAGESVKSASEKRRDLR
jgi:hypothetical protein